MASKLGTIFCLSRISAQCRFPRPKHDINRLQMIPKRYITCTETGAILSKPEQTRFGVTKALLVVIPFLYFGGTFASSCAALLEDYELFVPSEDDDD